jgi:hypothetical protein
MRVFRAALALISLAAVSCKNSPAVKAPDKTTPPQNATAGWLEIARTSDIAVYLDTARIERVAGSFPKLWYRFVYIKPFTIGQDTTLYSASDVQEEVDCQLRRTKMLVIRMETVSGVSVAAPTPDLKWRDMATDPMHSGISYVGCRALGTPLPPKPDA